MLSLKDTEMMAQNVKEIAASLEEGYIAAGRPVPAQPELELQAMCAWCWGTFHNVLKKQTQSQNSKIPGSQSGIVLLK